MSAFVLKLIACITMFIDHIGYVVYNGQSSWLNYVGRLAFPIFAFQISEGYLHTKNIKNYAKRLIIFALVSQIPFMLFHSLITNDFCLNVIFTLLFGLISIITYDKFSRFFGILVAIFLGIFAQFTKCDYGFYGVAITFLFFVFNKNRLILVSTFSIATLVRYFYNISILCLNYGLKYFWSSLAYYLPFAFFTISSIIIILLYNKKKGPNTRYLLYLFYPLHMVLLYAISIII